MEHEIMIINIGCDQFYYFPLDSSCREWFYRYMKSSTKNLRKIIDQKEVNIIPKISIDDPVVKFDLKAAVNEVFRFVSVGGDFV